MTRWRCLMGWSVLVLPLFLGAVLGAERERVRGGGKHDLLRGTVEETASDDQVTVRTDDGKEWKLVVDDRSALRLDGRAAKPSDFKKGTRVRVRYETREGKNRVVLMRTAVVARVVAEEGPEILRAVRSLSFDKRSDYEKKLTAHLNRLDERIEDLQDRIADGGEEAVKRSAEELQELRKKREAVRAKMDALKDTRADAWEDVKRDLDRALDDLQSSYDRARSRLK